MSDLSIALASTSIFISLFTIFSTFYLSNWLKNLEAKERKLQSSEEKEVQS